MGCTPEATFTCMAKFCRNSQASGMAKSILGPKTMPEMQDPHCALGRLVEAHQPTLVCCIDSNDATSLKGAKLGSIPETNVNVSASCRVFDFCTSNKVQGSQSGCESLKHNFRLMRLAEKGVPSCEEIALGPSRRRMRKPVQSVSRFAQHFNLSPK